MGSLPHGNRSFSLVSDGGQVSLSYLYADLDRRWSRWLRTVTVYETLGCSARAAKSPFTFYVDEGLRAPYCLLVSSMFYSVLY